MHPRRMLLALLTLASSACMLDPGVLEGGLDEADADETESSGPDSDSTDTSSTDAGSTDAGSTDTSDSGSDDAGTLNCDPTLQNCANGEGCYWTGIDFDCLTESEDALQNEPCGFINDCAAGLTCVEASALPACGGASCCTNFCDLGGEPCGLPGAVCVPFFEQGMAPPEYEHVGFCGLPP
jgi:hypothetical protein